MARDVIEVVARFGDTLLDVRYVQPIGLYRIGTAAAVDFALQGHTSFPLIDRGAVRIPVGTKATTHGKTTHIELGAVTFGITRMAPVAVPVPRAHPNWRPFAFVLASLIAHLALWLVAITLEPFEPLVVKAQPRLRYVHVDHTPLPDPPLPDPPLPAVTAPSQPRVAPEERRVTQEQSAAGQDRRHDERPIERDLGQIIAANVKKLTRQVDDTHVVARVNELGPGDLYNEDDANREGFGGGGSSHFDPTQREGWGTVESAGYVTTSFDVRLCPDKSCTITGPFPPQGVRGYLHAYMPAIHDCYARYASEPGTIVLEFTITRRDAGGGAVRNSKGHGLGKTGACAAEVVAAINFKALDDDTLVRYPIRFN